MAGGRPPEGPRIVRKLEGSAHARTRLEAILETVSGAASVGERSAIVPVAQLGSYAWPILLLLGFLMHAAGLILAAIVLFGGIVLFQIVTLPVEINASRRALALLRSQGIARTEEEQTGVRRVLTAAALTYIAAMVTAVLQLLYFVSIFTGRRN